MTRAMNDSTHQHTRRVPGAIKLSCTPAELRTLFAITAQTSAAAGPKLMHKTNTSVFIWESVDRTEAGETWCQTEPAEVKTAKVACQFCRVRLLDRGIARSGSGL